MSSLIRGVVVGGSLATAGLTSVVTWTGFDAPSALEGRRRALDDALPVRGWALTTHRGAPFTERDLVGRWSVVVVGYTRCRDACAVTLGTLSRALGQAQPLQALFLSVDPERDGALGDYVSRYHPDLVGLTGTPDALARAVGSIGASFAPSTTEPGVIDHSAGLFLIDPTANVVGVVPQPTAPDLVAEDLDALRREVARPIHGELWTLPGASVGAVYGSLRSELEAPVWVVGVGSPDLQQVGMHETVQQAGMARTVHRRRVALERDRGVDFEPDGLHLMVRGPARTHPPLIEWTLDGGHRALMLVEPRSP